ncbi:MAG TPA: hypothetical protein DDW36_03120 [Candidatus Magasanikbacteria bacterium]|nr:hypothetical protein [Candidatus Magasanikbacteria bacterium]
MKDAVSGEEVFSGIPPQAPVKVYDHDFWWSDGWDPMEYGREYDFSRSFFDQFLKLMQNVPFPSRNIQNLINSDYSDQGGDLKNCYLCFNSGKVEDSAYILNANLVKDSFDLNDASSVEISYASLGIGESYKVFFSFYCDRSNNLWFSQNCVGCSFCFGCINLRNKQYHIFNKPVSKEEYLAFSKNLNWCDPKAVVDIFKKRDELKKQIPRRAFHGSRAEDVSGEHLYNCKDVHDAFDVKDSENCKHLYTAKNFKDAYDISFTVYGELQYNSLTCGGKGSGYSIIGSHSCFNCSFTSYADQCFSSNNIFGCVGLKKKEYCILNKQYSKADYLTLVEKLKKHMQKTGEWGLFFPRELSPFAYNESIINEYHPLKREEALALGYRWRDSIPRTRGKETIDAGALPHDISKVPDTITHEILSCEECGNNYKVITQEVNFLKRQELPLPRACFDCRHSRRMRSRDKRILEKRACSVCDVAVNTTYRETEQPLMCESCYWKRV